MTDLAAPLAPAAATPRRVAWLSCLALAAGVSALALKLSATPAPALALALVAGLAAAATVAWGENRDTERRARLYAALGAAAAAARLIPDGARLELLAGLMTLGFFGYGVRRAMAGVRFAPTPVSALVAAGLTAALAAFNFWWVTASRDLMIADFMFYRIVSIAVGTLAREGHLAGLIVNLAGSLPRDYSWAPALLPGFALAAFGLLSRAVYQAALLVCYAAPALLALGWCARKIARVGGATGALVFALVAVVAAYPFGVVVAARGMPDIGGLALVALALRLADRLAGALSLRAGRDLRPQVQKLAFALALTLFGLFLFRRWYAFAAVALLLALAGEVSVAALRRGRDFRAREATLAAATGVLTLLALLAPVLVDWLPNPQVHDYAAMYAAYRKTPAALAQAVGAWGGFIPLALGLLCGLSLLATNGSRFARLAFATGPLAALLFLRVQSPYPHHLYLLAPWLGVFTAAALLRLHARSRAAGVAALAALAALTMTPAGALLPKGLFPSAVWPPAPRADLAELARLKDWVDARATPAHKVCGLGSSYTFSGQLIGELWQLRAENSPLARAGEASSGVPMTDVDTVDGPPNPALKDCAVMIVGDPVQTHVIPSYQITVTLPSREMLEGVGIGAHYRRTGEVFHLRDGVNAVVFEQTSPLTDADMSALASRWRAARASVDEGNIGR